MYYKKGGIANTAGSVSSAISPERAHIGTGSNCDDGLSGQDLDDM